MVEVIAGKAYDGLNDQIVFTKTTEKSNGEEALVDGKKESFKEKIHQNLESKENPYASVEVFEKVGSIRRETLANCFSVTANYYQLPALRMNHSGDQEWEESHQKKDRKK